MEEALLGNVTMRDYITALQKPLTVEKLKPLIGAELDVRIMRRSWGNMIVDCDKLVITNIKLSLDVESEEGLDPCAEQVYSDYYLEGKLKYNAWTSLAEVQRYLNSN